MFEEIRQQMKEWIDSPEGTELRILFSDVLGCGIATEIVMSSAKNGYIAEGEVTIIRSDLERRERK